MISLLFISCKKKESKPTICTELPVEPNQSSSYYPLSVGAIWIYETFNVDALGNETSYGTDTTRIIGDTVIAGNTFYIRTKTFNFTTNNVSFLRDSSGVFVNPNGDITLDLTDFTTIHTDLDYLGSGFDLSRQLVDASNTPITVPTGTYWTLDNRTTITKTDGSLIDTCGNLTHLTHGNYAKNVGLVFNSFAFFDQIQFCKTTERRLIYYNIPQ